MLEYICELIINNLIIIWRGMRILNIIFLDVDNVLNSTTKLIEVYKKTGKPHSGYRYPFDERCLNNLRELVINTKAKIVVTSIWRETEEGKVTLLNELKKYDLDEEVIGYTPVLNSKKRVEEIRSFLEDIENNCKFVILDDMTDMGEFSTFLVKTDSKVGLTSENVKEAIKILNLQN